MSLGRYLGLVKFEHTLFAMPFALISLLVASGGRPRPETLLWVLLAMVGARNAAMAFNRIVDRNIDARNPRTAGRHLPAGLVGVKGAGLFAVLSAALFVLAAWRLNTLCFALSPLALAIVLFYSLTKRFTAWSHLFLGLGLSVAPVGAWLAVTGRFAAFPLWLCVGVIFWVAGFDTIYGCQDVTCDRRAGLHSVAARFGVGRALWIARCTHLIAVPAVVLAVLAVPEVLGWPSLLGAAIMALLLIQEHRLVRGGDLTHIDKAFFQINSWIGMVLLACVLVDLYLI